MNTEFYENFMMPFPSRPHQAREFGLYRDEPARACLWKMRTGKSKAMIDLAFYLLDTGKIKTVFIVAPNGVHYNWIHREIPTHQWYPVNRFSWVSKDPYSVARAEKRIADPRPLFFAVNHHAIMLDRVMDLIKALLKRGPALLIVDESHHFRTPGAKMTKRMRAIAKQFKYRRILTGSAVDNAPFAAYSQFEILGDAMLGHATFAEFKSVYGVFEQQSWGNRWQPKVVGYQNLDVLKAKIERVSTIVGREGLSDFVHTVEYFEMSAKQESFYKTVKKDLLLALDNGLEMKSPEAGAKLIKLQQIASGFIIDSERQEVHELVPLEENPRIKKLIEVLQDCEGKSIIWCTFREELKIVAKFLRSKGFNLVEYHGQITTEGRNKAIDSFQKDPSVTLFLGQPAAGGEGINLSAGSNVIWFSHVFDAIKRNQASERATTTGGKSIALIDICGVGTVDEKILADLGKKKVTAESLIQSLRLE